MSKSSLQSQIRSVSSRFTQTANEKLKQIKDESTRIAIQQIITDFSTAIEALGTAVCDNVEW